MRRFMVIERFKAGRFEAVYARLQVEGRLLPDGLHYLESWVSREQAICFQLMQTDSPELFAIWFERWSDIVDFELFEVE